MVLLGDGAVGKTSLIRRTVEDKFSDEYITTIGTKVSRREMDMESQGATFALRQDHSLSTPTKTSQAQFGRDSPPRPDPFRPWVGFHLRFITLQDEAGMWPGAS